jgi:hypothetical protein
MTPIPTDWKKACKSQRETPAPIYFNTSRPCVLELRLPPTASPTSRWQWGLQKMAFHARLVARSAPTWLQRSTTMTHQPLV